MQAVIAKNPSAPFYSVSQNDDAVYCECKQCKSIIKAEVHKVRFIIF
jgi:hypothetical protein